MSPEHAPSHDRTLDEQLACYRSRSRTREAGHRDRVTYEVADMFRWRPARRHALVFFGFWLSHVPDRNFDQFWQLVASALAPGGRFFFVDVRATAQHFIYGAGCLAGAGA